MNVLVTGGAGYIGSFMTKRLLSEGHEVVVVDNLERGHKTAVDPSARFMQGDLQDKAVVNKLFEENKFDAVIHFAAYISMGESMVEPGLYFTNNVTPAINILEAMQSCGVNKIIFSSTAGVYGNPKTVPIPEDHPKNPTNPYGESKLMIERILKWYQKIFQINYVALRYFNACGASLDGDMGEMHNPESHIIPNAMRALLNNDKFMLFGTDYKTKDGTCVRDYIHVLDLVDAHILALKKISENNGGFVYNVGTGSGYSNQEIIDMIEEVSGKPLAVERGPRRPGDADVLIADATKIKNDLKFAPQHSDLKTIISSAWNWHKKEYDPK
jgi:UDP-glucose 4-epimerase